MVLIMARPTKRSNSSVLQFRKRVPADVLERARGQRVTFTFPSEEIGGPDVTVPVTVGNEVRCSLRARNPALVKSRHGLATAQLERFFENVRNGPQPLLHKQRLMLAGIARQELIDRWEENPGDSDNWERAKDSWLEVLEDPHALEADTGRIADRLLARFGIATDAKSRKLLCADISEALANGAVRLREMADGNYGPDKFAEWFPKWTEASAQRRNEPASTSTLTFDDLFERWRLERQPSASTVTTWSSYVRAFKKHLGHNDPHRVAKGDLLGWKDALITAGYALKGIRDGQLAAVRTLYAYAVDNDLLATNPAQGIKIQIKKRAGSRKLPYSDQEVARILELTDKERKPELRWLPWLMAMSGARVGEVAQLWGKRIKKLEGVYVMQIAPAEDGGSLKNEGSERTVPIHPAILERGFLDFVFSKGEGPLFYGNGRKNAAKPAPGRRHASKGPTNRLAAWIREQGFTDERKSPTHAFRHWFKSKCQDRGVPDSVADAIQGHRGNRGEADSYRHTTIRVMADAICRIDVPSPSASAGRGGLEDAA
jgi:intergrase/recombinase